MPTSMEVSSLALTENGRFVVLAHKASNLVSVWDVKAQKLVKKIPTETPGELLCRGDKVYVSNSGAGTITVLGVAEWEVINQLEVPTADRLYLSAPQGRYFDGRILITAFTGREGKAFALDEKLDRYQKVERARGSDGPVTCNYTGKFCVFKSSSSSYAVVKGSFDAIFKGEEARDFGTSYENSPVLRQVRDNEFWFGGNQVCRGLPPKQMGDSLGRMVVPDHQSDCFYAVDHDQIVCHAIDSTLTQLGRIKTSFPKEFDRMRPQPRSGIRDSGDADRRHVAVTIDDQSYVFVFSPTRGSVYHCRFDKLAHQAAQTRDPAHTQDSAEDGNPNMTVDAHSVGIPPVVAVGKQIDVRIVAEQVSGGKFDVIQGPDSIQIDPTGRMRWTPVSGEIGPHRIKIRSIVNGKTDFLRFNSSVVADATLVPLAAPAIAAPAGGVAEFRKLPTARFVSSMAVTEDGRSLLLAHFASDKISVWDLSSQRITKEIHCASPGPMISRGLKTFVGNDGEGSVSVIDHRTWTVVNKIDIGQRDLQYLTAPQGKYFKDTVVVTTRIDSNYRQLTVVDTQRGRSTEIPERAGIEVLRSSYSGKSYITQSRNNGSIDAHGPFSAFVANRSVQTFGAAHERSPQIQQVRDNEFWFGDKRVFHGLPPRPMPQEYGRFVIPDRNHDVFYAMYPERIECVALDGLMTELGRIRTTYPTEYEDAQKRNPGGTGIAVTRDGKLHLFVAAVALGNVYYQTTSQFNIPASIESSLLRTSLAAAKPHELPKHVSVGQFIEVALVPKAMQGSYGEYKILSAPDSVQVDRRGNLTWTPTMDDVGRQQVRIAGKVQGQVFNIRLATLVHDIIAERNAAMAKSKPVDPQLDNAPAKREWKDATGNFTLTADLVSYENGIVTLKKADGSQIKVPANKLSQTDQDYLADQ